MKKLLLILSLLSPVLCSAQKKGATPKIYDLVIGAYTRPNGNKGIAVYRFYAETGKLAYLSQIDSILNPTYVCVSPDRKFVYSGGENKPGVVSAFKFDYVTGKLVLLNKQPAGASVVHVAIDKKQKNVFAAAYSGGNLTVLPINKDGSLAPPVQTVQHEGTGTNKTRQEAPHTHSSILSPDEKYLMTADLGTDKINVYKYSASKNPPLTPADPEFEMVKGGNGPRQMTFSDDGKYMYLVQEMGSAVNAYAYNKGKLTFLQSVNLNPDGYTGRASGGDVHISPDGAYLYASNRGINEIVQYAINPVNGQLTFVSRTSTDRTPRSFLIVPAGNFIIVSCQDGNSVTVFKVDKVTGNLSLTGNKIDIPTPVAIQLVPAE